MMTAIVRLRRTTKSFNDARSYNAIATIGPASGWKGYGRRIVTSATNALKADGIGYDSEIKHVTTDPINPVRRLFGPKTNKSNSTLADPHLPSGAFTE